MTILIPIGKRRAPVSWTPEARALFRQIADEIEGQPDVRVALPRTGKIKVTPMILARRQLAVAGLDDGIAVRLNGADKDRALGIFATRELGKGDRRPVRGMIAMPWSTHEQWREFMQAAVNSALNQSLASPAARI